MGGLEKLEARGINCQKKNVKDESIRQLMTSLFPTLFWHSMWLWYISRHKDLVLPLRLLSGVNGRLVQDRQDTFSVLFVQTKQCTHLFIVIFAALSIKY